MAEGVETEEELQAVIDTGVRYGQGHVFARPAYPMPDATWPGRGSLAFDGVSRTSHDPRKA